MEWKDRVLEEIERCIQKNGMKAELAGETVCFVISEIGDRNEWKALGQVSFIPYIATGEEEEVLQIYLTIAQNVDTALKEKLSVKFMELNDRILFGRMGMNDLGQIFYQYRLPVVGQQLEALTKAFEFVSYEMLTFLDAFYAYVLVIINEPDKLTLSRYVELMLTEEEN